MAVIKVPFSLRLNRNDYAKIKKIAENENGEIEISEEDTALE